MSGIAGIVRFDGHPPETARLESMLAGMGRRGPDGIGRWSGGSVALGHLMMHTTPESLSEQQPLASADGELVLVGDGRIDNREELSASLSHSGARPLDATDAALFLAAYESWGDDFPRRIEGDFALAIWDARRRAAICVRDRIGAKPFLYHWDGRRFAFASEVRPIVDLPWVDEELNEATVAQFLMSDIRSFEGTFWRGVRRLPPALRMIVTAEGLRSEFYWKVDLGRRLRYRRDEDYVDHYRSLLGDVVRRMSRSHRPLAFEVSGGLDSSALFAVADEAEREGRLQAPGMDAYTLKFDEDSPANELGHARAVAAQLGRPLHEIDPVREPLDWYFAEAARFADFPGYPNGVMHHGLWKTAAEKSRTLISGLGGDEILLGSPQRYLDLLTRGEFGDLPRLLRTDLRELGLATTGSRLLHGGVRPMLPRSLRAVLKRIAGPRVPARYDLRGWLSPRLAGAYEALASQPEMAATGVRFRDERPYLLWLLRPTMSHVLEINERPAAGMLELRHPYMNAGLVSFSASLPERLLTAGAVDKRLHRWAMRTSLPPGVLGRRDKAEFTSVFAEPLAELQGRMPDFSHSTAAEWADIARARGILDTVLRDAYVGVVVWQLWSLAACIAVISGGTVGANEPGPGKVSRG